MMDSGFLPQWAVILEAANHDPLRAMEIEAKVSQTWWSRYSFVRGLRADRSRKDMS